MPEVEPIPKVFKPKKATRPLSKRGRARDRARVDLADSVPIVQARSRGTCEAAGDKCTQRATVIHHKAGRVGPDAHHPDRLMHICEPCHLDIHANPQRSYVLGHMERRVS